MIPAQPSACPGGCQQHRRNGLRGPYRELREVRATDRAIRAVGCLSGRPRKFFGGQGAGSWPRPARWTVQAVSRASCGVPTGRPVTRAASW